MGDRQNVNVSLSDQVGQVVGKSGHRDTSHVEILRKPFDRRSRVGRSDNGPDSGINRGEKGDAQASVTLLVPPSGVVEFR